MNQSVWRLSELGLLEAPPYFCGTNVLIRTVQTPMARVCPGLAGNVQNALYH